MTTSSPEDQKMASDLADILKDLRDRVQTAGFLSAGILDTGSVSRLMLIVEDLDRIARRASQVAAGLGALDGEN
ncbi:hypothetical protein [Antarctobacter jejuensis]|uniref:hypothetical protein n=1 Tax=Antarctobacter jejuensis TaxID=1439938 RepID=UPI003FD62188